MATALPPHSLAQTRPCLHSLHSPVLSDCGCCGLRGTSALRSNIYCRGCLRVTFTTCTPALPVPPPASASSTTCAFSSRLLLYPPCARSEATWEAAIPTVLPPRSHCRIDPSELPGSATEPTSLAGSTGTGRLGRQEGVKQDTGTVRCALLATPRHPRTCSSSPVLPRPLCPLGWADFLQQKEQGPGTPDYPAMFARGRQRTTEPW